MSASTMQKPKANQVLCEKCGEFCNFDDEKCPACGAPLFDDGQQANNKRNKKETEPKEENTNDTQKSSRKEPSEIKIFLMVDG